MFPLPDLTEIADAVKFFCYSGAAFFLASTAVTVVRFLREFNQESK